MSALITQPSIKKFNLIIIWLLNKYSQNCWVLEFILTSNKSIMVSYEKIIRRFLKFHLVFKWELFVSFRAQMVPPFLFHVHFCVLQCSILCQHTLVLLPMDSYEAANGLKTSHIWTPGQYLCDWYNFTQKTDHLLPKWPCCC